MARTSSVRAILFSGGGRWIRTTEVVRQQIYSLPPLAAREFPHIYGWSWWTDSNPRPADYKSAALPTELHQRKEIVLEHSNISAAYLSI